MSQESSGTWKGGFILYSSWVTLIFLQLIVHPIPLPTHLADYGIMRSFITRKFPVTPINLTSKIVIRMTNRKTSIQFTHYAVLRALPRRFGGEKIHVEILKCWREHQETIHGESWDLITTHLANSQQDFVNCLGHVCRKKYLLFSLRRACVPYHKRGEKRRYNTCSQFCSRMRKVFFLMALCKAFVAA